MSLNKFSELFLNLDSSNSTNMKLEILKTLKETEAKNVFFHHGDSESLIRYLNEKNSINVLEFESKK